MNLEKFLQGLTRAVVTLTILSALLAVADELMMLRSDLFDMKRMLAAHTSRSADAPKAEASKAPQAPSSKATAHAEVP